MGRFGAFLGKFAHFSGCLALTVLPSACGLNLKSVEERKGGTVVEASVKPEFEPQDWFLPSEYTNASDLLPPFRVNWSRVRERSANASPGSPVSVRWGDTLRVGFRPRGETPDCDPAQFTLPNWREVMVAPRTTLSSDYYIYSSDSERSLEGSLRFREEQVYVVSAAIFRGSQLLVCIPKVSEFIFDSRSSEVVSARLPNDVDPAWGQHSDHALGLRHRSEFLEIRGTCAVRRNGQIAGAERGDRMYVTFLGVEQGELMLENADRIVSGPESGMYSGSVYIDSTQFPETSDLMAKLELHCETTNGSKSVSLVSSGVDYEPPKIEPMGFQFTVDHPAGCRQTVRIPCAGDDRFELLQVAADSSIEIIRVDPVCDEFLGTFGVEVQALSSPTSGGGVALRVTDPADQGGTMTLNFDFYSQALLDGGRFCGY